MRASRGRGGATWAGPASAGMGRDEKGCAPEGPGGIVNKVASTVEAAPGLWRDCQGGAGGGAQRRAWCRQAAGRPLALRPLQRAEHGRRIAPGRGNDVRGVQPISKRGGASGGGPRPACARAGGRAGLRRRGAAPGIHRQRPRWAEERGGQGEELQDHGQSLAPARGAVRARGRFFHLRTGVPAASGLVGRARGGSGRSAALAIVCGPSTPSSPPPTAPAHPRAERCTPRLRGAPAASPERGRTAGSSMEPRVPQGWGLA